MKLAVERGEDAGRARARLCGVEISFFQSDGPAGALTRLEARCRARDGDGDGDEAVSASDGLSPSTQARTAEQPARALPLQLQQPSHPIRRPTATSPLSLPLLPPTTAGPSTSHSPPPTPTTCAHSMTQRPRPQPADGDKPPRPPPYRIAALLRGHSNDVRAVASSSSHRLFTASRDGTARSWARASRGGGDDQAGGWAEERVWRDGHEGYINAVSFVSAHPNDPDQHGASFLLVHTPRKSL